MSHPVIGMRMVADDEVIPKCFPPNPEQARKWCFGGGPGSTGYLFAHNSKVALHAIEEIKHALEALPTSH
jgi:hypothetical protein